MKARDQIEKKRPIFVVRRLNLNKLVRTRMKRDKLVRTRTKRDMHARELGAV